MDKLIVVGNGKLADEILIRFSEFSESSLETERYSENTSAGSGSVFVHVGSGRQYRESLELAVSSGSSYIQAATEKDFPLEQPEPGSFVFINSPNLDINIIKFFQWLKLGKDLFKNEDKTVTESHQAAKSSLPGTALKICGILGMDESKLISIRDTEIQKNIGIRNLPAHAYHRIQIGSNDSVITFETKIEGLLTYVSGLAKIVRIIPKLSPGNYEIEQLLKYNLF